MVKPGGTGGEITQIHPFQYAESELIFRNGQGRELRQDPP